MVLYIKVKDTNRTNSFTLNQLLETENLTLSQCAGYILRLPSRDQRLSYRLINLKQTIPEDFFSSSFPNRIFADQGPRVGSALRRGDMTVKR